ncbi:MAG: sugar phosphate isomerase/epimerase family protein [Planctomycetota bacterium]
MYSAFSGGAIGVNVGFEEAVELAAHYGFEGIYLDLGYLLEEGPETIVYMLEERSLKPAGWVLPVPLTGDQPEYEEGLERLKEAADAAMRARALRCCIWISPASDQMPYRKRFDFMLERLNPVCQILDENEIRLGLEFIGPATSRQGKQYEFIHDMEGMLALCRAVETDNCGLLLDSWHLYTSGGQMDDVLELEDADVVDVHINDAPEGVPREEQIDNVRRLPGETGVIDVGRFLRNLQEIGYSGPVMCEPFSERLKAMDNEEAVETTKSAIDSVWPD